MATYRARVKLGADIVDVSVGLDGYLDPRLLEFLVSDAAGQDVYLTATGPTVALSRDDPYAIVAWLRDEFEILEEEIPDGWDDPRTRVPDGAVA